MNRQNQLSLAADYPTLLRDISGQKSIPPAKGSIAPPVNSRGIECGDGWYAIIKDLCKKISVEVDKMPEEQRQFVKISHIKEKNCVLTVNMVGANPRIHRLVYVAQELSRHTCEQCGENGVKQIVGGKLKICCEQCASA